MAALNCWKSRMSAQMERTEPATPACSNKLGWVGGSSAYPVTSAPSASSHSESQLPLNPVCPVRNTRRPFQNERFGMTARSSEPDLPAPAASPTRCFAALSERVRFSCVLLPPEFFD